MLKKEYPVCVERELIHCCAQWFHCCSMALMLFMNLWERKYLRLRSTGIALIRIEVFECRCKWIYIQIGSSWSINMVIGFIEQYQSSGFDGMQMSHISPKVKVPYMPILAPCPN